MTDATMDEAANTAILLEQHIQEKILRALVDITLPPHQAKAVTDTLDYGAAMPYAVTEFRRMLMHSIAEDPTFTTNMRYLVIQIVREEIATQMRTQQELEKTRQSVTVWNNTSTTFR